jgi:DNA polymerase-3 subunit beta
MNIICERDILNGAITPALSAVSAKVTENGTDGLLLTADKGSGTLTVCGYDLEKGVKVTVSGENVQINESGSIILNAVRFSSVVKNLPDGSVSVIVDENLVATVKNGRSKFEIHGLGGGTFPLLPELKGQKSLKLQRKALKNMIASTLFSVANNNSRPALNGALFEIKDKQLNIVACDGVRLAVRRSFDVVASSKELDLSVIIPGKSLAELLKLIGDDETPAAIELAPKHIIVSFDDIVFFSRLIESEFLDYRKTLNITAKTTAAADTRSFSESVERAAALTDDKSKTQIKLSFRKDENNAGTLQVTSASTLGKVSDECGIEFDGDDVNIGFNQRYLAEVLKAVKDEKILLKLESPMKALIMLPCDKDTDKTGMDVENGKFVYLALPVRMKESS